MLLLNQSLLAQWEPCGTATESSSNYAELKNDTRLKTRDDYVIPVKIHVVTDDNGHYEANVEEIIDEMNLSATYFDSVNIILELCEIDFVENSEIYHFDKSNGYSLISSYNEVDVINLYIVQTLVNELGTSLCGTAFYPWSFYKIIVVKNSCATNGSTIAHEIGHYLGLYHTHDNRFGYELVDQSNCEVAGDLICDTPADPKLSTSSVNPSCSYIGTEVDSSGNFYQPNPEMLMSYSRKACRSKFTEEQGIVMRNVFDDYYPNYQCEGDVVSVMSEPDDTNILVFPNPVIDVLNIVMSEKMSFQTNLYNLQGIRMIKSANETKLSVGSLPEGIYLLEIKDLILGHKSVHRIVISR